MGNKIIIRCPKGFQVRYKNFYYGKNIERVFCKLYDLSRGDNYCVGHVELERISEYSKTFVTHSSLHHDYQGQGFGKLLYSKAIAWALNNGFKVRSSGDSSDLAKRVWSGQTLRKKFDIRSIKSREYNDGCPTWYAYQKGTLAKQRNKSKWII